MPKKEDIIDRQYLVQHLVYYVDHQLSQGYGINDLEKALLHYGYDKDVVVEVIKHVKFSHGRLKPSKKHDLQHISHDLYYYTENLLIDYVMRELEKGYKLEEIKKNLIKHGHEHKMVEKAVSAVKSGRVEDIEHPLGFHLPRQLLFGISLFLVFVFVIFLSISTDSSIGLVLLSFAPSFFSIALVNLVIGFISSRAIINFLPLAALGITAGIFIGFIETMPAMRATQEHVILILNCVVSFVGSALICFFSSVEKKKKFPLFPKKDKKSKVAEHAHELTPDKREERKILSRGKQEARASVHHSHELAPLVDDKKKEKKIKLKPF